MGERLEMLVGFFVGILEKRIRRLLLLDFFHSFPFPGSSGRNYRSFCEIRR